MARRSDHSRDEIREMAVSAAVNIVKKQGVKALTARRIAADIGYTIGTLYVIFGNLDGLITEVNARTLDDLYRSLQKAVKQAEDDRAQLSALCQAYYHYASRHRSRWQLLFDRQVSEDAETPAWYMERVQEGLQIVEAVLSDVMTESDEAEIQLAARSLWGSIHGISMLALTGKLGLAGENDAKELIEYVVSHVSR